MWIDVAAAQDVPQPGSKSVRSGNTRILLVRTSGGLFALDDRCPHQEQTLEHGDLGENFIECPWHSVKIELSTGKILFDMGFLRLPDVRTFPVREENGRILVQFPDPKVPPGSFPEGA
jgi:nitrite reductase/ring-hydroxylating ferredoxin subunit